MKKAFPPSVLFLICALLVSLFIYHGILFLKTDTTSGLLAVTFLDVGQGDATFIESPTGTQVLIDGGRDRTVLRRLPSVMGIFDRNIDIIIATHPDSDHINGLIDVLERYEVGTIIMTNNVNDTPAYNAFMRAVENEKTTVVLASRGQIFDLGWGNTGSTTLTILFPDRDVKNLESNTSSIIAKLSYGDADFMLTGDSPSAIETYLVDLDGTALRSEILKVGHHGSRTSTDPKFLEMVRPRFGIISAGKDNDYGHPHKEVLDTLRTYGVETKNTADVGSVLVESDGDKIWFK